jgi:hypothetical protein
MTGTPFSSNKLNKTLNKIVKILLKNKIYDWFIAYGTLLGIVRNNSCINNDDDIDIIINIKCLKKLLKVLEKNNYKILYSFFGDYPKPKTNIFIKVQENNEPTIDFYFALNNKDIYHDLWENKYWYNCILYAKPWKDTYLLLPKNPELKLKCIYGDDWETPRQRGEYTGYNNVKNNIIL